MSGRLSLAEAAAAELRLHPDTLSRRSHSTAGRIACLVGPLGARQGRQP